LLTNDAQNLQVIKDLNFQLEILKSAYNEAKNEAKQLKADADKLNVCLAMCVPLLSMVLIHTCRDAHVMLFACLMAMGPFFSQISLRKGRKEGFELLVC